MRRPREPELPSLASLLPRFPEREVVVVGDFVADEYVYGETERISREAPVLIVRYESSELKAGGAGNAAANLAALGVKVRAVGVVGDDGVGGALLQELTGLGVDVSGIQRVPGRETEAKTRILAGGRSTRRQQMIRLDRAPRAPLPATAERRLVKELERAGRRAGTVLASDYGSGALGPAAIEALRALKRGGVPVCVDSRYNLRAFTGLTMVKPNEVELETASGVSLAQPGGLEKAARALLKRVDCDVLLVTRGRNGMSVFRRGAPPVHVPAHGSQDAVDVTGAGDTVAATFSAGLAAGGDPVAAARLANVAGSLVVQKPGTATVSREELQAELLRP
ncbi:bifunctional heptose 7-phosphate kinase/heptose 1-phosphate adenyltransferase [Anaeromyxobacter sp. PSR-1]|uniref:bifunctional heptose 7-phosphate kinase/heptose 1-phosphate adenyltransferase n=1 Tax=unclassified Anaeromyxobacter TaxID=2620896 RepID=UPI0005E3ECDA|nr:PfkB family carbohydrate kinase [Anaeromyxobacter sp. PSR-1]GAO02379.1 bifunctional protein HldE [Anaeromyxobacter sp. PSR-1]